MPRQFCMALLAPLAARKAGARCQVGEPWHAVDGNAMLCAYEALPYALCAQSANGKKLAWSSGGKARDAGIVVENGYNHNIPSRIVQPEQNPPNENNGGSHAGGNTTKSPA